MLLQGLILAIRDNKTRERLLTAEDCLSLDSASRIARNHESVARSITQLQTASIRNSCEVPINATRPTYSNAGVRRFCRRCGEKHFTPAECQHRFTICNLCKKRGHIAKVCFAKKEHYQAPARVHAVEDDSLQDVETIYQV